VANKHKKDSAYIERAVIIDNIGPPIYTDDVAFYRDNPDFDSRGQYELNGILYHRFVFTGTPP
jgi:hypothetical protein